MGEAVLEFNDVEISYGGIVVVEGVDAQVRAGEVLCIVGESGSGKSSLIRAAMGLLGPGGEVSGGRIAYDGRDLVRCSSRELRRLCGSELAMIFQDCLSALTPIRTIGVQLAEMARAHGASPREVESRFLDLLESVNIDDPRRVLSSYPFELSGGMGQRMGIGMALSMQPKVLFADEPTSALDTVSQRKVVEQLLAFKEASSCAIVLVTHSFGVARAMADAILVLKEGRAVEVGLARSVLESPQHPYTRELLDAVPVLERRAHD